MAFSFRNPMTEARQGSASISNVRGNFGAGRSPTGRGGAQPRRRGGRGGTVTGTGAPQQRQAYSGGNQSLSQRLAGSFSQRGPTQTITSSRGTGVNSRQTRALAAQKKKDDDARNKKFEAILKAQREQQAALMEKARGAISKQGKSRREDIQRTGVQRQATGQQSLISRGLGNTTIQDSVRRGINASTDRAMTAQGDFEAGRMADTYSREAGMQLGQGQFQLGGVQAMGGGLEEYIAMLASLNQGGLS